ncbi:MAG: arsinothricin resistance N-acetyltransferase ArsN1 family B [Actinomycetota bacterium]
MSTTPEAAVRPAQVSDAEAIRSIYGPIVTATSISFEDAVPSPDEIVRRMRSRPKLPWLVAISGADAVGFAYAGQHRTRPAYRWSAECSVYVAETHRGQGVGRRLYERLITEVIDLGYASLFAGIALPNPASVALHEGLGFRPIGVFPNVGFKFGAWHDVGWWALALLTGSPDEPAEPREWT